MATPEVSAPAFMRNYHEVLRNDLTKVLPVLLRQGDLEGFARAWGDYTRAIGVHAVMEDGAPGAGQGSVAMLNHYFDGVVDAAAFAEEHHREHEAQAEVTRAIVRGAEAVREAFGAYAAVAEAHMQHEEEVMQPLVVQLPNPKAPKFAQWCLSAGLTTGGMEHFLAHGVTSLGRYGSGRNPPAVATRVFLHAFQAVCTPEQWAHFAPVAKAAAPAEVWAAMLQEVPGLEPQPH